MKFDEYQSGKSCKNVMVKYVNNYSAKGNSPNKTITTITTAPITMHIRWSMRFYSKRKASVST